MPYLKQKVSSADVWLDGEECIWKYCIKDNKVVLYTPCCGNLNQPYVCDLCEHLLYDLQKDIIVPPPEEDLYEEYLPFDETEIWELQESYKKMGIDDLKVI